MLTTLDVYAAAVDRELARRKLPNIKAKRETLIRQVMLAGSLLSPSLTNDDERTIWAVVMGGSDPASSAHLVRVAQVQEKAK